MINKFSNVCRFVHARNLIWVITILVVIPLDLTAYGSVEVQDDRPNIVLLVSEDNSIHYMDHFTPGGAKTPNIDKLADEGIIFDRAFSNSPVCSVARSTVMNGVYAPRSATHHHRAIEKVKMPEGWELFPYYLRNEGYFTVVNGKKDFNMFEGDIWDEDGNDAHWSGRPSKNTPFFYMEQTGPDTHESRLHFDEETYRTQSTSHDPDEVELSPYFPDTELFRYTHATYLDRHLDIDRKVGQVVEELKKDGLIENTIIIYYGDHGGVLPRSKGYVYESGLHVPMVVYIPEKFRDLSPFEPGSRVKGFVEFIDLGPTILNLAGVGLQAHMDGTPFLGKDVSAEQVNERDETFSSADRFDEKYDMVRALRKGNFKYIRNFHPYYPDGLWNRYRYIQLAYMQWRDLYKAGELNSVQSHFFEEREPEALYDISSDPHEINNLAGDPQYAEVLNEMRSRLRLKMRSMPDLGLFTESYLVKNAVQNPLSFAQENTTQISHLLDISDLMLLPFEKVKTDLKNALESDDRWKQYWALIVCSTFGEQAKEMATFAKELVQDESHAVRIRAAEFLGVLRVDDPITPLYDIINSTSDEADILLALNTMTYLRDHLGYYVNIDLVKPAIESNQIDWRLEHLKSND
jgi:uncharacterized sulfatase